MGGGDCWCAVVHKENTHGEKNFAKMEQKKTYETKVLIANRRLLRAGVGLPMPHCDYEQVEVVAIWEG